MAVLTSRRSAKTTEFFVAPQIAEMYGLKPRDLNWALDALEGKVTETQTSLTGKFRRVRLLPHWESQQEEAEVFRATKKGRTITPTPTGGDEALVESAKTKTVVNHSLDPEVERLLLELAGNQPAPGNDEANNQQQS